MYAENGETLPLQADLQPCLAVLVSRRRFPLAKAYTVGPRRERKRRSRRRQRRWRRRKPREGGRTWYVCFSQSSISRPPASVAISRVVSVTASRGACTQRNPPSLTSSVSCAATRHLFQTTKGVVDRRRGRSLQVEQPDIGNPRRGTLGSRAGCGGYVDGPHVGILHQLRFLGEWCMLQGIWNQSHCIWPCARGTTAASNCKRY